MNKEIDTQSKMYKFVRGKGIMNLANQLTISRIVMIPIFVLFFYLDFTAHYFVALGVFLIASFTDLLDGMIARKYNLITNFGKFLDPIADKVLVLTALIVFITAPEFIVLNVGTVGLIVFGCGVALIIAREIIVSGFRMIAASSGRVIAADIFGKYKTVFQYIAIIVLLIGSGILELVVDSAGIVIYTVGLACFAMSIILTIVSGINYIVKNREVLKQ